MTDQDGEYTQDTSQEQNDTGGPEIPKTPETPKIGERVRNFFGGNKKEEQPKQETPQEQPGPAQEPQKTEAAEAPVEGVQATVDGKPVNAEVVTENNRLPATGREGVQETPQDVTQYKEPRETYVEPDDHPGPYTGVPKELGAGPEQKTGDGAVPAPALGAAGPPGGGKEPADEDDDDKDKDAPQAQYDLKAERNALAKQHATKFLNAFAQTAAEMGGQMASKGWDLAGNIVKMTFTQPHAMSSTSRMIGTAMSALQTAGDFADRSVQKYGIDVNADPNLMKNTIRYKLYKREAEMGKNTVGNTFRAISESLGNMGLQDASQMTPDQLDQHVQDMRAEADRLTQALKDPKLSNSERSLIKAQAQHLQGYMDGLAKQGAGMAQDQRIAARRQKRQDLATRRQNYQVLADGSPNPYREALEWADPRFGIEVDPQTGRPTNPSAYNRILNAVITQRQNEAAAAERVGKKLDPAREKWFNDLQNRIHNDIQAMKQDKAENPLRGRAEIYARIGRVAPGFEKYIDNIERTGTFPSNSTQSTRAIRKVLADYLTELKAAGKVNSPEYNHAKALLTSMDKYNNMKKLMSRIASLYPTGMERARKLHELANDQFVGEIFTDDGKIKDYMTLVQTYANLMKVLPRNPVEGGKFNPSSRKYVEAEKQFNDDLTYFINKWFPDGSIARNKDDNGQPGNTGGNSKGGTPGGDGKGDINTKKIVDEILDPEVVDEGDTNGIDDKFINGVFNELRRSKEKVPEEGPGKVPEKPPVKVGQYAHPKTEQDNKFLARFPNYITVNTWLKSKGITSDKNPHMSLENYNKIRDFALKSGVSPEVFDSSPFATRHLPFEMMNDPIQQVIYDQKYRPGKERRNYRVKPVKGWEAAFGEYLSNNPEIRDLMSKNARGEDLTAEESAKVMQALVQNRFRDSSKLTPPGKKKVEDAEALVEEEAEQSQLPAVTENDFIRPEVASQFRDARNIESINEGIAAIQSLNRDERASGYNDILYGLGTELGNDALFSEEYQNLMQTAFMDGSSRAIQLMSDQAQDPKDKLKILMAGRVTSPKSNESAKMLADFIAKYGNDYDVNTINTIINDVGAKAMQAQSDKDRAEVINTFLDSDLDSSLFNHKEGGKKDDTFVDEEETDETFFDPNSTDAFEQDADPGRGLVFSKDSQYKDFKSMAEAMGKELGITQHSKVDTARGAIDTWLRNNKIGYAKGVDADALKDEITKYLRKNGLIPSTKDESNKDKGKREDSNLEDMKSILSEGPAADKDSIVKDKRKVNDFKKRIKKKYAGRKGDADRVLKLFNEFMKDYESNMKEQYVNHGDMAWRAQAISDFLKWDQISTADRNILTPKTKTKKNKTGDPTEGDLNTEPLDEVPEYDPAKRDEFMNEMNDFSKYGSGSRLDGAYIATLNAHNKALDNIQGAIDDLDTEIAAKEKIRGQQGWTIEDEDNLEKLYNMKGVLKYNMSSWKKSKEAHEYYEKFSGVYDAFNKASDKAEHGEPLDTGELEAVEAGISTLSDEDQKLFAPLMDHLRAKAAKSDREQNINEYAKLQAELNKLKNDAEGLKKERELDEVRSSLNDMLEGFESGTLEMSKELDKNFSEFVKKLPAKERDSFNKKLEGLKKKATFKKICEKGGFADESDPTKWLKEISECTDESTLAKKVNAYEMYIATQQENAQKGLYRSLERAKDKADQLINSSGERLAAKLIKNIQEHGYHAFDVDMDEHKSKILGGATSEDEMAKAKELWEKVMEARDISKTLEDKFGVSYSDFIEDARSDGVQNDMWKVLSNKVKEAYSNGDEGSGLAQEYRLLIKKMKLNPAEADLANKLLEIAIPKKNTTKSLSVRDLFRARNADWE